MKTLKFEVGEVGPKSDLCLHDQKRHGTVLTANYNSLYLGSDFTDLFHFSDPLNVCFEAMQSLLKYFAFLCSFLDHFIMVLFKKFFVFKSQS